MPEPAAGHDIFIGYASQDRAKAKRLAAALESKGWSVWWDVRIPAGKLFDDVIEEAVSAARCVVVLWSKRSVSSRWVRTEAAEGSDRGILVPVLIESVQIPFAFKRIQAADLIEWQGSATEARFQQLVGDIEAIIGQAPIEKQTPSEPEESRATPRPRTINGDDWEDRPEPLSTFRDKLKDGSEGPEMVVIPAGSFVMGSPMNESDRYVGEGPQHEVTFAKPFAVGKYSVTFDEFERFCAATDRTAPSDSEWGRGKRPVINVAWKDAEGYTAWLSAQTGKRYRLPSEAEWEYGARAGTKGPFSFEGPITSEKVNYDATYSYEGSPEGQHREQTVPVGTLPANPWGLHEVHGNVWEWILDCWHDSYENAPNDGSAWLESGGGDFGRRVIRGGSWLDGPRYVRSAYRFGDGPDYRNYFLGFRLAQDID